MTDREGAESVLREQVQRLRQLTELPWMECKRFLESLAPDERAPLHRSSRGSTQGYFARSYRRRSFSSTSVLGGERRGYARG